MKVLIGCEFSGIIREEFLAKGHDAYSCDFLDSEIPSPRHYKGDLSDLLTSSWDLLIAHPPCTYLCVSGNRWMTNNIDRQEKREEALQFVMLIMTAPIKRICIENPVGVISSRICKPNQIIQPYEFGHAETKATCLWLKNLPKLKPTDIVTPTENRIHKMPPSVNRWKERSRTYTGVAKALAEQYNYYY